jgi:hypothetical protein
MKLTRRILRIMFLFDLLLKYISNFGFAYLELSELQDSLWDWKEPRYRQKRNVRDDQNSRPKILLLSGEEN